MYLEKGSEVGAHILSGAVVDPIALNELIPDWKEKGAPLNTPVVDDRFYLLGPRGALRMPNFLMPPLMNNHGNYAVSLGNVCRWLATQAEGLGVEIYPGFACSEVLYREDGSVRGVVAGVMGIAKDGSHKPDYQPGMELIGKYVFIAEGVRGSLAKEIIAKYKLSEGREPQKFGLGMKELWEVKPENHKPGQVTHTMGWPLGAKAGGGSFMYHLEDNLVSIGFVVHLNYRESPPLSLHGVPALQAPSADCASARRRQAGGLWCARHYRRWLPVGSQALFPRRRFDRLFRRLRECAAHQGFAQCHEDRHDGRRSSLCRLE